jgi:uncharacterized damage-inducible protein DinB
MSVTNLELFRHQCSSEFPRFVSVLESTPADRLDYRPHPRSRSAHELVAHLIGHELDLAELLETGVINHRMQVPFASLPEALTIYRTAHGAVQERLRGFDPSTWESESQFVVGGTPIMTAPRRDLAWMLLFDAIHHRGQLSTYLRPMGGTVPSIYGPSADTMMAKA